MSRILNFLTCVKDSSINIDSYTSKKNVSSGLKYFIVLLFLISLLTVIPNIYGLFSDVDMDEIPDFEIQNGKLSIDVEQPYYIEDYFIIDTTGNITEPVVDESGQGILVTEDSLILKRTYEERSVELSALGITNKEELETLIYIMLLIISPLAFIMAFLFNIIKYLFYISVFSLVGYILTRHKNTFKSVFSICIYAFTPCIILSYIDLFARFYLGTIGLIWTLIIFGLVLKKQSVSEVAPDMQY